MGKQIPHKSVAKTKAAYKEDPKNLGPKFGMLVIKSDVPMIAIAAVLDVSTASMFRWFYGEVEVPEPLRPDVVAIAREISSQLKSGNMPHDGERKERIEHFLRAYMADR